jgi:glycosyltransferase involved in cell wall biosynthesis
MAIESVLTQTFKDFELLIIDDASVDETFSIFKNYAKVDKRIVYFKNKKNLGISRSRNLALEKAQGKYIAILDSDDIWCDRDKLKRQVEFLEGHQNYVLVGGGVILVDEDNKEIIRYLTPLSDEKIRRQIFLRNPFVHSSVMYLKKAVLKVGSYDESLEVSEDYDLFFKLGKKWKFVNLNDFLVRYRVYTGSDQPKYKLNFARNSKKLVLKYKDIYPNFWLGLFKANLRVLFYFIKDRTWRKSGALKK